MMVIYEIQKRYRYITTNIVTTTTKLRYGMSASDGLLVGARVQGSSKLRDP